MTFRRVSFVICVKEKNCIPTHTHASHYSYWFTVLYAFAILGMYHCMYTTSFFFRTVVLLHIVSFHIYSSNRAHQWHLLALAACFYQFPSLFTARQTFVGITLNFEIYRTHNDNFGVGSSRFSTMACEMKEPGAKEQFIEYSNPLIKKIW